jgi:hypothetical protein
MGMRRLLLLLFALGSIAVLPTRTVLADANNEVPVAISPSWPSGVQSFLKMEESQAVFNVLYHYGKVKAAAGGAYGPNLTAPKTAWYVEYQRAGNVDVTAGVLHRDASLVAEGLTMFHFALLREARNGGFPGSFTPFHGTAMFLAESVPSLIVLRYSPMQSRFASELAWETSRLRRAARHLVQVVHGVGKIDDHTKNHRFYEAALALGSVGVLADDPTLIRWSRTYAQEAIAMERPGGIMPEDGGHDTGYQALGMTYAMRYLTLVATGSLARSLRNTIAAGAAWELSRVHADGTIDQTGDTRTVDCKERNPVGQCKTTFYDPIFSALAHWSVISGDSRYERAAYFVWLQNWRLLPGDVLPKAGLWVKPETVTRGQWLTVWGTRFQPLETVKLYYDQTEIATLTCDQIGSFGGHSSEPGAHFPAPDVSPGEHTITARGSFGTVRSATVRIST